MSKDEALKLALEALEVANSCVDGYYIPKGKTHLPEIELAITAIKEALMSGTDGAQPEHGWTSERIAGIARLKEAQDKRLAQPEQEPVAWMDDYNACKCPDNEARCFSDKVFRMMQKHTDSLVKRQEPVAKVCHDLDGHIGWNPNLKQLPNEGTPLYTSPPQREWVGLSDEEIDKIYEAHHNQYGECESVNFGYERAIEAKLKEKNT